MSIDRARVARNLLFAGPCLLVGGLIAIYLGFQDREQLRRLRLVGVNVPGVVIRHQEQYATAGQKKYRVTVDYQPQYGPPVQGTFPLTSEAAGSLSDGAPVTVRYLRSNPQVAEIAGVGNDVRDKVAYGAVAVAVGVASTIVGYRSRGRKARDPGRRGYSR